jgi:hypothetical protein
MKTIKRLPVAIAVFFMVSLGACEIGYQNKEKGALSEEQIAFEQGLNQVLVRAGEKLSAPGGNRSELSEYFRSAYIEVFTDKAELAVFEMALADVAEHRMRKEGPGFTELLVATSDTPEAALERIAETLAGDKLDDELIIELLVVRQSIIFMMGHHKLLVPELPVFTSSIQAGAHHNDAGGGVSEYNDDGLEESWWSRWGSCAAGIIGSAGTGGIYGCAKGFTVGLLKGCIIGGTVGTISGGLVGAATFCSDE